MFRCCRKKASDRKFYIRAKVIRKGENQEDQVKESKPEVQLQNSENKLEVQQERNKEETKPEVEMNDDLLYVFGCIFEPEMTLRALQITAESIVQMVLRFDPLDKKWTPETAMSWSPELFGSAVIGAKVYICGGRNTVQVLARLDCYDTQTQKWTRLASMTQPRMNHAMAALNGRLYVCGGCDFQESYVYNSVECYSPETDTWEFLPEMLAQRVDHELIVHDGKLMALGGADSEFKPVDTTELYFPVSRSWVPGPKMLNSYASFGAVSLGDKVYVSGGMNIEVLTDQFRPIWKRPQGYDNRCNYGVQLAVLNGRLVAIGGKVLDPMALEIAQLEQSGILDMVSGMFGVDKDLVLSVARESMDPKGKFQAVKFIDEFDEKTKVWTMKYSMIHGHRGHGIAIVKRPI